MGLPVTGKNGMTTDEQQIRDLIAMWIRESMAGNVEAVLPLMANDVAFLLPGRPPMRGREAFAAASKTGGQTIQMEGTSEIQEIEVAGHLAYCWSQLSITMSLPNSPAVKRSGNVLSVFRKNASGTWELFRDANLLTIEK